MLKPTTGRRPRRRSRSPAAPARHATASRHRGRRRRRRRARAAAAQRRRRDHRPAPRSAEASRDWWPLAMSGRSTARSPPAPAAVARPTVDREVAAVLAVCNEARVPVTAAGGRSGVSAAASRCTAASCSTCARMSGIVDVDDDLAGASTCCAGTFGDRFEAELPRAPRRDRRPLAAVDGAVDRRRLARLPRRRSVSTRYGKIEDIVVGLEVVLADGRVDPHRRRSPARPSGPTSTRCSSACEGTLGVITEAWLRAHPAPAHRAPRRLRLRLVRRGPRRLRRILQRGATPAVLRLYDATESTAQLRDRGRHQRAARARRGRPRDRRRRDGGRRRGVRSAPTRLDDGARRPLARHRNDVAALEALITRGYVVDTMEVAGPWAALPGIYDAVIAAIAAVPGTLAVLGPPVALLPTAPASTSRSPARSEPDRARRLLRRRVGRGHPRRRSRHGGALSHHHGVGLNRARFVAEALGPAVRRARRGEGGARPERHPQPRQARPARPVRRGRLARDGRA